MSLIIDYITTHRQALINPARLHMFGHSRNGKQTLIAAAYDERIRSVAGSSPGFPVVRFVVVFFFLSFIMWSVFLVLILILVCVIMWSLSYSYQHMPDNAAV